jgi:hypothetical protein
MKQAGRFGQASGQPYRPGDNHKDTKTQEGQGGSLPRIGRRPFLMLSIEEESTACHAEPCGPFPLHHFKQPALLNGLNLRAFVPLWLNPV